MPTWEGSAPSEGSGTSPHSTAQSVSEANLGSLPGFHSSVGAHARHAGGVTSTGSKTTGEYPSLGTRGVMVPDRGGS